MKEKDLHVVSASIREITTKELTENCQAQTVTLEAILEGLADDIDSTVRRNVAQNPNTSKSVLEKLADDSKAYVRKIVAINRNTPETVLKKLADDIYFTVRKNVAQNPNTSKSVLEKLASDSEEYVRKYVAGNSNTTESVLKKLASDSYEDVRKYVAINPNILQTRTVDEQIELMKVASYIGSTKSKEVNHSANMEKFSDIIGFKMYLKGLKQKLGKCANIESDTMVLEFIPDKKDRRKEN